MRNLSLLSSQKSSAISLTAYSCLIYLSLPLFAFLTGWIAFPLGIFLALVLFAILISIYRQYGGSLTFFSNPSSFTKRRVLLCALVAFMWVFSGGFGEFIFTNYDWQMRGAILRDLTFTDWPAIYPVENPKDIYLLRLPLGYYLIPALIGKISDLSGAYIAAFIYVLIGAFLFLTLITEASKRFRHINIVLAVVVLFNGMKIIGLMCLYLTNVAMYGTSFPFSWPIYMHMWSFVAHYSAITTELYWSPNHAMPAMLLAALWWRYRESARLLQIMIPAAAFGLLWSPFATVGIAPMLAYSAYQHRRHLLKKIPPFIITGTILIVIPVLLYLTISSDYVPKHWLTSTFAKYPVAILTKYIPFLLLEFGVLIGFLYMAQPHALLLIIGTTLSLLPLYWVGFYSDFAQQASMASIVVLALITGTWLAQNYGKKIKNFRYDIAVIIILAIGAITPLQEIVVNYINPRWHYQEHCSLIEAWGQSKINPNLSPQIAKIDELPAWLQPPNSVTLSPTPEKSCWPDLKKYVP